ncbi:MAG: coenzyme F420-0:L-glutamate ligase, partial [Oscillospiraceae bacterium]|nr:coenzyme F420-0:L-glutamate ligase [Oscillospiraceae bacterium]
LTEKQYRDTFGYQLHPFTGIDYVEYYKELIEGCSCQVEILFSNKAETILQSVKNVLCCDIHTRARTKRRLMRYGAEKVLGLDDILTGPVNGSGYNGDYGLLGSNKATEDMVKLFPRNCDTFVNEVQDKLIAATGKQIEVMVYGDGAFKDPVGKIWELADPVVSPGYTSGLEGQPNELKIKYLADNDYSHLTGQELTEAVRASIRTKDADLKGNMASQGTTPRRLTDLIGSLCDLTSGSGDKGTPVVFIQGYFDNYSLN